MHPSRTNPKHSRRGFTLIEMLLVLGLLVLLMSIAYPSLSGFRLEQQLRQGAELVRLQMKQARLHAMESGFEYQFRYEEGGRQFVAVPAEYSAVQAQQAVNQQSGNSQPQSVYWKSLSTFESKINFSKSAHNSGIAPQPLPKEFLNGFPKPDDLARVAWGPALVFRTDGSAQDFSLELENAHGAYITISVRGITGGIEISPMLRRTAR